MVGIIEEIVEWAGPVFAAAGYYIVFGAVALERSVFIGLFVPGDVILALGGIYAARGDLDIAWVIVLGAAAALIGESVGFWLGRRYGLSVIRRLPLVNRLEDRLESAREFFNRHGGKTVFIGRYATAAGAFIPFTAGVADMSYPRFLAFDFPAVVIWATGIALIGYFFQAQLDLVDRILSRFGWIMLGLLAAFIVGRIVYKRWKGKKQGSKGSSSRSSRS
jgi:membrane-associated protein